MLKKLLKYDFKAVLKIWWIAAVAALAISAIGGLCMRISVSDRDFPIIVYLVASLGMNLTYIGLSVFAVLSTLVLAIRFYRNFFTDQGYLTFTLPVTKGQLLNSKLIVSMVTNLMSVFVFIFGLFLMLFIGTAEFAAEAEEIIWADIWEQPRQEGWLGWLIVYIVEVIVIFLLNILFSDLFLDCCITFGSIIAKKAKVVASIGIYYVAYNVFSFVLAIFLVFGISSLTIWLININISDTAGYALIALLLFGVVAIMALFCSLLYTLQYWMLDRKLNLS